MRRNCTIAIAIFAVACLSLAACKRNAGSADKQSTDNNSTTVTSFAGLQTGDLIFVTHPREDDGIDTIHVAILYVQADGLYVIDATLKHGVDHHPLDTLFSDFTRRNGSVCDMYVMRMKDNSEAPQWIASALSYKGEPYDLDFKYDNGKHYCSELVQDAYTTGKDARLFETSISRSSSSQNPLSDDWQRLFHLMGMPLPEANPGISPAEISRSDKLVEVPVDLFNLSAAH